MRRHGVAVDLAGLVAAGQGVHRGDHGQLDADRRPGGVRAQDQVGQAVEPSAGPGSAHRRGSAQPRRRRPAPAAGRRRPGSASSRPGWPSRPGRGTSAPAVPDRRRQPPRRRGGVGAQHRPPRRLPQLGHRLPGRPGQQPRPPPPPACRVGRPGRAPRPASARAARQIDPASSAARVAGSCSTRVTDCCQQRRRRRRGQPQGDHHLVDGPLTHRGQRRRAGRPRRRRRGAHLGRRAGPAPPPGRRAANAANARACTAACRRLLPLRRLRHRQLTRPGLQQPRQADSLRDRSSIVRHRVRPEPVRSDPRRTPGPTPSKIVIDQMRARSLLEQPSGRPAQSAGIGPSNTCSIIVHRRQL